ncbi:MAG: hypothetical protein SOX26_08480 [Phocaeicola sp.]|nr:hypothetical protein [Phocaeicola sp.]
METKHLLFTMALAGAFSACNNEFVVEENISNSQTPAGQERPTVSNPTLNVEGADSRVSYDGSFKFEKGDVIGALLMDENNTGVRYGSTTSTDEWKKLTWLERYHLVDYIHTDYPFVYDGSKFNANCNMLEGNYFLIYPYTCQAGNRQVKIDFADQTQIGQDEEARKKFVAKHQRFVGYAQLKAGEGASDFTAQLQPILAPVRFGIKSEGNVGKDLHITKVVVTNGDLKSTLTVDPTRAQYGEKGKWNLKKEYVDEVDNQNHTNDAGDIYHFNYVNFLANQNCTSSYIGAEELYKNERFGSELAEDYVYNVADGNVGSISDDREARVKSGKYYWDDAVRSTVVPMDEINNPEYDTRYVEVKTWESDATPYLTLKSNETVEVIMMLPAIDTRKTGKGLNLTIYTQEGIVKDIDLSKRHNGERYDVITTGTLTHIDPVNKNIPRVEVILDNPDIIANPETVAINNGNDLLQIVKWINSNPQQTGDKETKLSLINDIVITDEIAAEIEKLRENYVLTIENTYVEDREGNNLKINTSKEHANVLEHMNISSKITVEVMPGAVLNMTDKSYNIAHEDNTWGGQGVLNIEVAQGGLLNIDSNDKHTIQGGANSNGQPMPERTEVRLHNMGTVEIYNDTKVVGFYFVNEGEFNVRAGSEFFFAKKGSGFDNQHSQNTIRGTINVDKGAQISGSTMNCFENYGTINNAGKITNIKNYANRDNKKPGLINILNDEAYTDLSEMTGMVDYNTHLTGVHFNNTINNNNKPSDDAIFKYTHADDTSIGTSALKGAWVTDADIVKGYIITDFDGDTYIKNLVMEDGTYITNWRSSNVYPFIKTIFRFNKQGGFLTLKDNTTIENVQFFNVTNEDENILLEGRGIMFKGTIDFNDINTGYSNIWMDEAELTVNNGCTVRAKDLKAVDEHASQIYNYGIIYAKSCVNEITISINKPILK